MNRAERRKMMKTIPGYKKALKSVNDIIDNKLHLSGYAAI